MKNNKRDERRNFCIENNLLVLINTTLSEKETLQLLDRLTIRDILGIPKSFFSCVDPDMKDLFFELTGLMMSGSHNERNNEMQFKITQM